jgi:hypothetical protein
MRRGCCVPLPKKQMSRSACRYWKGELGFVYAYVGAPERVLDFPERTVQLGLASGNGVSALVGSTECGDPENGAVQGARACQRAGRLLEGAGAGRICAIRSARTISRASDPASPCGLRRTRVRLRALRFGATRAVHAR